MSKSYTLWFPPDKAIEVFGESIQPDIRGEYGMKIFVIDAEDMIGDEKNKQHEMIHALATEIAVREYLSLCKVSFVTKWDKNNVHEKTRDIFNFIPNDLIDHAGSDRRKQILYLCQNFDEIRKKLEKSILESIQELPHLWEFCNGDENSQDDYEWIVNCEQYLNNHSYSPTAYYVRLSIELGDTIHRITYESMSLNWEHDQFLILHFIKNLCEVIKSAGNIGLLFLDLKPQNLVYCFREGNLTAPYLIINDFDVSVITNNNEYDKPVSGTWRYESPEQLLGYPVSTASDLFSVALMCYELLGGKAKKVFGNNENKRIETFQRMCKTGCKPPIPPNGSNELKQQVIKALSMNPAKRGTVEDLLAAVEQYGGPAIKDNARIIQALDELLKRTHPVRKDKYIKLCFAVSTVVVIAFFAITGDWIKQPPPTPPPPSETTDNSISESTSTIETSVTEKTSTTLTLTDTTTSRTTPSTSLTTTTTTMQTTISTTGTTPTTATSSTTSAPTVTEYISTETEPPVTQFYKTEPFQADIAGLGRQITISGNKITGFSHVLTEEERANPLPPLPEDVVAIGENVFHDLNCSNISLEHIQYIGENAFSLAELPSELTLPSIVYVGNNAFLNNAGINTVSIGSQILQIGAKAFWNDDFEEAYTVSLACKHSAMEFIADANWTNCKPEYVSTFF